MTYLHLSLLEPGLLQYHQHCQAQYCIVPPAEGILTEGLTLGGGGKMQKKDGGGQKIKCAPCVNLMLWWSSGPTFTT